MREIQRGRHVEKGDPPGYIICGGGGAAMLLLTEGDSLVVGRVVMMVCGSFGRVTTMVVVE